MAQDNRSVEHPLAGKHIIVAGAGIAGLSFARALELNWSKDVIKPKVTLYERREKLVSPDQEGYSISIRSDVMSGGMQALQKLGILDDTLAASITGKHGGAGRFRLWDTKWKPIMTFKQPKTLPDGLPAFSMRVARYVLRQHLLEVLPESVEAHWGVGCVSASKLDDGKIRVDLSDGSTADCDVLVAADGANSKIRASLRPTDTLEYAGAVSISAQAKFPDGIPDPMKQDHGIVLGAQGNALFVSPIDDTRAIWSISFREPKPRGTFRSQEVLERKDEIVAEARSRGKMFDQPFGRLLDATDPKTLMVFDAMDKQPIDHSELNGTSVVFIGDANHAVSPFAGNGANMALMDGVDLAVELSNAKDLPAAVTGFDGKSMARSKRTVQTSHWTIAIAHSTGWRLFFWKGFLHFLNFLMSF